MTAKTCPTCAAEMNRQSASGRDHKARDVGVSWHRCPECETIIDVGGNVSTKEDQKRAIEEARRHV